MGRLCDKLAGLRAKSIRSSSDWEIDNQVVNVHPLRVQFDCMHIFLLLVVFIRSVCSFRVAVTMTTPPPCVCEVWVQVDMWAANEVHVCFLGTEVRY